MDLSKLNDKQIEAVKHIDGPLLILAGAGSGKTTTMTYRIAYMIEQGIDPFSILAVTFTNKAAGEMRARVENLAPGVEGMWIMTFHAMCLRILRYHAHLLGYKSNFTVYDETDKKSLLKRILKSLDINDKENPISMFVGIISDCKERELTPDDYLAENSDNFRAKTVYDVFCEYEREMMRNNAMDFDDLLLNGVKVFEADSKVLAYYRRRFRYIMVDEYQDTNYIQYKLIKYLATGEGPTVGRGRRYNSDGSPRNLCVVGDDDQCIYAWRGADIRNILDFERDFPEVKIIKLEQNYRSTGNILSLANSVIEHNIGRKGKTLWTDKAPGEKITYRKLNDEKSEAWFIGSEIEHLREQGYNYRDMAILYRKNAQSRPFEEKFMFRRLPYRIIGGIKFYERKEIKDAIAYLKLIDNPNDDVAMLRVINEPKRGVGAKTLAGIQGYAASYGISLYQALKTPEVIGTLTNKPRIEVTKLIEVLDSIRAEADNLTIDSIYDNVIKMSGYLDALEADSSPEATARLENIMEFRSAIVDYQKGALGTAVEARQAAEQAEREDLAEAGFTVEPETALGAFLAQISLRTSEDDADDDKDEITLMTLHSAKGLEFPVVFMPGMENGVFPGAASFDEKERLEEERRLCYVGITRAMHKLYLTAAEMRMIYGKTDYSTDSIFLNEMDKSYLDGDQLDKDMLAAGGGYSGVGGYTGDHFFRGRTHGTLDGYAGASPAKPFDTFESVKKSVEKKISNEGFEIGDTLIHPKFGQGMLIEQDAKTMTIVFDSVGQKKIGKGFVELERK